MSDTDSRICIDCQRSFDAAYQVMFERRCFHSLRCDECEAIATAEAEKEKLAAGLKIITDSWEAIAPVLYRDSDISRFPKNYNRSSPTSILSPNVALDSQVAPDRARHAHLFKCSRSRTSEVIRAPLSMAWTLPSYPSTNSTTRPSAEGLA